MWQSRWEQDNGPQLYDMYGMPAPPGSMQCYQHPRFRHNPYSH